MNTRAGKGEYILQTYSTKFLWRFNGEGVWTPLWVRHCNRRSGVALATRHRLCGLTMWPFRLWFTGLWHLYVSPITDATDICTIKCYIQPVCKCLTLLFVWSDWSAFFIRFYACYRVLKKCARYIVFDCFMQILVITLRGFNSLFMIRSWELVVGHPVHGHEACIK